MASQQLIKGNTPPFFLDKMFGKRLIQRICMGETAVGDFCQMHFFHLFAAIGNAAKKKRIPFSAGIQIAADLVQSRLIKASKENIVFKDKNVSGFFFKPHFQANHMGLKNPLFPIIGMFCDNDEFHALQQTDIFKLFPGLLCPIGPRLQGDTIDLVKKGPAVRLVCFSLVHGTGFVIDGFVFCGISYRLSTVYFLSESYPGALLYFFDFVKPMIDELVKNSICEVCREADEEFL
jgi:hypothetical protein